jgi:nitroimidazol reductase NimA-like FMN-containing flavoprotein (pyridoxamine 5'-phosphate oxidase superfamily)
MEVDRNGLEVLSRHECLSLLRSATIGRLGLHVGALPTILPVNFRLTDQGVVVRTAPGTKLDAATVNAVVAFEVDDLDPTYHGGWSVVVVGVARPLESDEEQRWARQLPLAHWAPGDARRHVCISTDIVTGRRIPTPRAPAFRAHVPSTVGH